MLFMEARYKLGERLLLTASHRKLTSSLCLTYFATLLVTPESYKYVAALLAIIALFMLPITWQTLKSRPAMLVSGSLLLYFLVTLVFALPSGHYTQLDMPSRTLLATLVFALLLTYPPSLKSIFYGCSLGASVVGVIALYQHYVLDIRALSTNGYMSIQAAGMTASLSVFSIFAYVYSCQQRLSILKAIAFLGVTLGFSATLFSGGRGAWIITPFVALWAAIYYRKTFSGRDYLAIVTSVALIAAMTLVPALNRAGLILSDMESYERVTNTTLATQPTSHQEKEPVITQTPLISNSLGIRLELWKAALLIAAEHPITGAGYSNTTEAKQRLVEQGDSDAIIVSSSRAHNQFLEELQVKGLIGFGTLIFLLVTPWVVTRSIRDNQTNSIPFSVVLLRCHLILIAGYMLTQHYINHHSGILFFSMGVVIFASIAIRGEESEIA